MNGERPMLTTDHAGRAVASRGVASRGVMT